MNPNSDTVSLQQVYADSMLNTIADQRNQAQNQVAALTAQVRVLESQVKELQDRLARPDSPEQPVAIQKPDPAEPDVH